MIERQNEIYTPPCLDLFPQESMQIIGESKFTLVYRIGDYVLKFKKRDESSPDSLFKSFRSTIAINQEDVGTFNRSFPFEQAIVPETKIYFNLKDPNQTPYYVRIQPFVNGIRISKYNKEFSITQLNFLSKLFMANLLLLLLRGYCLDLRGSTLENRGPLSTIKSELFPIFFSNNLLVSIDDEKIYLIDSEKMDFNNVKGTRDWLINKPLIMVDSIGQLISLIIATWLQFFKRKLSPKKAADPDFV